MSSQFLFPVIKAFSARFLADFSSTHEGACPSSIDSSLLVLMSSIVFVTTLPAIRLLLSTCDKELRSSSLNLGGLFKTLSTGRLVGSTYFPFFFFLYFLGGIICTKSLSLLPAFRLPISPGYSEASLLKKAAFCSSVTLILP